MLDTVIMTSDLESRILYLEKVSGRSQLILYLEKVSVRSQLMRLSSQENSIRTRISKLINKITTLPYSKSSLEAFCCDSCIDTCNLAAATQLLLKLLQTFSTSNLVGQLTTIQPSFRCQHTFKIAPRFCLFSTQKNF